ncbi:MAG: PH domain-containing protein [Patescibacteria group bacterium]
MLTFSFFNKTNYTFEGKKDGEQVILFLHRHWWTIANRILIIVIAAFAPFVVAVAFGQILIAQNLMAIFAFLWASYYLLLWFFLFYILTIYNLNSWIVTNLRIIDQHQRGFFNQEVAELSLVNIQDVSFKMEGMIATMMNYGNIEVQTAGNDQKFRFSSIPNPQHVKDEIMKIADSVKGHNGVFNPIENPQVKQ